MSSPQKSTIGTVYGREKTIIDDPRTGVKLHFLTNNQQYNDQKIYHTHTQWTQDGRWIVFRSDRADNEAMAVHEQSGMIVQVTQGGFEGMLIVARKSMRLYFLRPQEPANDTTQQRSVKVFAVNLDTLLADAERGIVQHVDAYQQQITELPAHLDANCDMALDANEDVLYFRTGKEEAGKHLPEDTAIEDNFGPRNMGSGPGALAALNLETKKISILTAVPFQIGHIQANPWKSGEILFCWETGGKAPQRTWIFDANTGKVSQLYPESDFEWVTHEAIIGPHEVAFAIMGHRKPAGSAKDTQKSPGTEPEWGPCGTREKPTGLAIINVRTKEVDLVSQLPYGSGFWHVHGSPDGTLAAGDNFKRELYLVYRKTGKRMLLTAGHKETASDHVHPTFSPDGRKIMFQSAMLAKDAKSMSICVIQLDDYL